MENYLGDLEGKEYIRGFGGQRTLKFRVVRDENSVQTKVPSPFTSCCYLFDF